MSITKDHLGGLLFLCFSIVYGYYATHIELFPGDEFEPFNARSMPTFLAGLGICFSLLLLLTTRASTAEPLQFKGIRFPIALQLMVLMVLFGLALDWIGFLLATIAFLMGGFWILGERRLRMMLIAAVPFSLGFWCLLTQVLDIYLAPGWLVEHLMGGL